MTRSVGLVLGGLGWLSLVAAIFAAGTPMVAPAEESSTPPVEPVVTDRPTDCASPEMVPRKSLQIDVRGGLGLVDTVPDWLAGVGLAFRLPL
jgi:hypothetical protein